jgi:DNA uptake protein ComE-like DNA-binding protein
MGIGDRLTVHSFEPNLDAAGQKRVNVNSVDADTLKQRYNFSDALAQGFVSHTTSHAPSSPGAGPGGPGASSAAGRSSTDTRSSPGGGPSSGGGAGGTPGGPEGAKPSGGRFGSLFELLDVQPAQQGQAQANSSSGQSGKVDRIDIDWLAQHWDELTLTDDQRLPGRINVNTAAPDILMTLPDMAEAEMDAICQRRDGPKGPFLSVGELYISKTLSQDRFKSVAERVCVRSGAFEVRSIATTRLGVRRQIVAIVDRTAKPASILYWYQGE